MGDLAIVNQTDKKDSPSSKPSGRSMITYKDGPFTDAFIHGKVLLLDEMSLAPPAVIQSLLSYLFGKKIPHETDGGTEECPVHADFRVIATQNPAGSDYKRSLMSSSIKDCFRIGGHAKADRYFPNIEVDGRKAIICGMLRDNKVGSRVAEIHERAVQRTILHVNPCDKGKDYTLRDCTRAKALWKQCQNYNPNSDRTLTHALQIAYNEDLKVAPLLSAPMITFTGELLDADRWDYVYDRVRLGLDSGCHILLVGESEYVARKYCRAILEYLQSENGEEEEDESTNANEKQIYRSEFIHCSSSSSTEGVIGGYILQKNEEGEPVPVFASGPFLNCIEKGGICVLQSMENMKSNVIERLNSVLELLPEDDHTHVIRFDERREKPTAKLHKKFRVIATTSEQGLQAFSPALRNRFLEVIIGHENEKKFYTKIPNDIESEYYDIEEIDAFECMKKNSKRSSTYFEKMSLLRSLQFIRYQSYLNLDDKLVQSITKKSPLSELKRLGDNYQKEMSNLFYSICKNKATVLHGPRACGKTYLTKQMLDNLGVKNYRVISVSPETDFNTLMGSTNIKGDFCPGLLMEAVEKGYLVVFENAENMSSELREQLDLLLDPFTDDFTFPEDTERFIHPAFRVLFIITTRRSTLSITLPQFFQVHVLPALNSSSASSLFRDPFCKILCNYIDSGEITFGEILTIDQTSNDSDRPSLLVAAALFVDRREKNILLSSILQSDKCKSLNESQIKSADVILKSPKVAVQPYVSGRRKMTRFSRGKLTVDSEIPFDELNDLDISIKNALFTALLTNYNELHSPLLLVGDPDITNEVARILQPQSFHYELSGSIEASHLFGEISVCREEDIEYILRSIQENGMDLVNTPLEYYRKHLEEQLDILNKQKAILAEKKKRKEQNKKSRQ